MQKFATPAPVTAVLAVPAGRVRFIAGDRTDTVVEVLPADPSRARDVALAEQTEVSFTDGVLHVRAPGKAARRMGPSGAVEVTVQLPAGSRVEARAAAAEFRGVGRLGDVTVESAQGTVRLDETTRARLTLEAGDITVGRLTGPAALRTRQGNLHITEAVHGTVTLRTDRGDITVGAARTTSATLDAATGHGRIHNGLRNTDGPTAGLALHATTAHGDITARSH